MVLVKLQSVAKRWFAFFLDWFSPRLIGDRCFDFFLIPLLIDWFVHCMYKKEAIATRVLLYCYITFIVILPSCVHHSFVPRLRQRTSFLFAYYSMNGWCRVSNLAFFVRVRLETCLHDWQEEEFQSEF